MMNDLIKKMDLSIRMLLHTDKKYLAFYLSYQKQKLERIIAGRPYVLCSYYFPSELTSMFDTEFLYIERIVGLAVSSNIMKGKERPIFTNDICSYHNAFVDLIENNIIPKPQFIMALSYPCHDAKMLCEYLHSRYNIPLYIISGQNYERELKKGFHILKERYSLCQNINETVEFSNQAVTLKKEIDRYRLKYPGIMKSDEMLKIFTLENDFGSREAVDMLKLVLKTIKDKTLQHSYPDSLRILWMGLIPLYDNSILSHIEKCFPCTFVYEEMWMFGHYFLTEDNFFENLSSKIRTSLFYHTRDRIERLLTVVKETKAELIINFSQRNCSFLPPKIKEIEAAFAKEGLVLKNLDADVVRGGFERETLVEAIRDFGVKRKNYDNNAFR